MKAVFVVLVLFVGYNSGVVPSVISKAMKKSNLTLSSTSTKEASKEMNLQKSNKIPEKELLQTSADKENNLNERSFIFINQRFKKPLKTQLYNSQTHNLNKPFTISERLSKVIPRFSAQVSPLKELFIPNIKIKKGNVNKQNTYSSNKNLHRELKNMFKDQKYALQRNMQKDVKKPATFRPLHKHDSKKSTETADPHSQDSIRHYEMKKHQEMNAYARHRIIYNYGFPLFENIAKQDLFSMPNDKDGNLVSENIENISPLDLTDENDKFLERFIKETLNVFDINNLIDPNDAKKCKTKENSNGAKTGNCDSNERQNPKNSDTDNDTKQQDDKSPVNFAASIENNNLFTNLDY